MLFESKLFLFYALLPLIVALGFAWFGFKRAKKKEYSKTKKSIYTILGFLTGWFIVPVIIYLITMGYASIYNIGPDGNRYNDKILSNDCETVVKDARLGDFIKNNNLKVDNKCREFKRNGPSDYSTYNELVLTFPIDSFRRVIANGKNKDQLVFAKSNIERYSSDVSPGASKSDIYNAISLYGIDDLFYENLKDVKEDLNRLRVFDFTSTQSLELIYPDIDKDTKQVKVLTIVINKASD